MSISRSAGEIAPSATRVISTDSERTSQANVSGSDSETTDAWFSSARRSRPCDLRNLADIRLSRVAEDCDLRLSVSERSPYTTSFDLTYLFEAPEGVTTYPDMRVRIYHDARLVEAQEWATQHEHDALRRLRGAAERELDQRWARNTMLNKWLEYCIDRGHGFRA